jgi:hypothetical protein
MTWSLDGQHLPFEGHPLSMSTWKRFVEEIIEKAERRLLKDLLFWGDGKLPLIDLYAWNDNRYNRQPGYYFPLEDLDAEKKAY